MRQLAHFLPALPGIDSPKTYAAWPVWSGSTTDELKWPNVIKAAVLDWYHKARKWNAAKEIAGRYGGTLGSAALRVLESLVFDFQNYKTGQLDPSYEAIATKTGLGRSTVAEALRRLRQFGLLHWVRRSAHDWKDGKFRLKQITFPAELPITVRNRVSRGADFACGCHAGGRSNCPEQLFWAVAAPSYGMLDDLRREAEAAIRVLSHRHLEQTATGWSETPT